MPGSRRPGGVKSLLKIAEWAMLYLWLSNREKQEYRHVFKQERSVLRIFYELVLPFQKTARAYEMLESGVLVQAALFSFLILGAAGSTSPHMIWVSFGGGLASSVTVYSIWMILRGRG